MKKYFIVILLLVVMFPFISAKADIGSICDYEGWLSKSTNQKGTIKTTINKDKYMILLNTIFPMETSNAMSSLGDILDSSFFTEFPHEFTFSYSLKTASRTSHSWDWVTPGSTDYDVTWANDAERTDFRDKGYCPSVITIKSKSGLALTGDFDYELIVGAAESPSADGDDSFDKLKAENFYLKASVFSPEVSATIKMLSTTCSSDIEALSYFTKFYDFTHTNLSGATNSEKEFLADLYEHNGFTEAAQAFIDNYSPGTECYENNPSAQETYDKLVEACDDFLYTYAGGGDPQEVDTCDQIIGNGTFAYYLNQAFRFIQYLGPVLVIIYSTIEYIKVAATSDADLLKKTNKRTIIRMVFALLLFLIPMIIKVILNIIGFYGNCLDTIL